MLDGFDGVEKPAEGERASDPPTSALRGKQKPANGITPALTPKPTEALMSVAQSVLAQFGVNSRPMDAVSLRSDICVFHCSSANPFGLATQMLRLASDHSSQTTTVRVLATSRCILYERAALKLLPRLDSLSPTM
jgi:hypothetical protein